MVYTGVQVRYTESRVGQRAVVKIVKWRWVLVEVCSVPAAGAGRVDHVGDLCGVERLAAGVLHITRM